ncbi:hypothetical protein [Gardnerella vaginalis]|uniref:hypothetical protein n=1 Tax=Gardnerella vaginalis TaxID=2702 RepID=UPI000C9C54B0|nr:hypothetical protein [Gardnerella vaginalis]PMC50069.1 hypothetical protein CJ212_04840 [Gardnerella vaginalis]
MGKHGCKKIPIFLRNKRTRMFSLLTALLATIAIVVGNGVISGAYAFDDIPTYISNYSGCGAEGDYKGLYSVNDDITYCVDLHESGNAFADTSWGPVVNNRDVAIAAMMIKLSVNGKYWRGDYRDRVAIAYAIHEHFEDKDKWNNAKQHSFTSTKDFSEIAAKADELWNEAASKIPTKVSFENLYGTSGNSGEIKVKAEGVLRTAYNGDDGVDFKITASNGNIMFKDNYYYNNSELKAERKGFIRTDKDYSDEFVWVASGEGKVDINGEYYLPNLERRDTKSGCYLLRLSQSPVKYNIDSSISIDAHRDFYPAVTSKSEVKKLKLGDSVEGNVKSSVNNEENKPWIENKKIRARGYYFVGSYENILKERAVGSSVDDYIKELRADSSIRQVGASDVYFTKSGEEAKTVVHVTNGDMKPENLEKATEYKVGEQDAGLFGTWVWTIAKNEQDNDVKDFVSSDFIEGFGKAQSTLTHMTKVNIKHVKNAKNKDSNEVSDTIVVSGAPKDYGMFKGNKEYGFDGDENMKVRLWWIGYENGTVDKESMSKLNPKSDKEPEEDDNHKKIGEWSVPLRNGVYTIANGKVMLKEDSADGAGNSGAVGNSEKGNEKEESELGKKVADIVNLKSGNSGESGMYVFVYDFPGSSRAEAFKTAFNDEDSRSIFTQEKEEHKTVNNNSAGNAGDVKPSGGAKPNGDKPNGGSKPSVGDVKPNDDVKPNGNKPNGDEKPNGDVKPNGGDKPSGDVKPSGDAKPNGGNKSDNVSTNNNDNKVNNNDNKVEESGEVTKNEIDPKTSAGGAVVDNIVNKQDSHDQGAQQNNKQDTQSNTQPNTNQNTQSQGNSTQTAQNQGGQNAGSQKQHKQTGDVEGKQNSNINADSSQSGSDSHSAVNSDNTNVNGSSQKNNESNKVDKSDKENNAGVVDKTNAGKSGKSDNAGNAGNTDNAGKSDNARNAGSAGKSDKSVNAENTENVDNENLSSKNVHSDKADKSSKKDSGSSVTVHKGNTNSDKKDGRTTKRTASAAVSNLNTDEQNDNKSKKEASDLGSESLAESQSEYTNTKRNKRRHARAGVVSATSLFNAGIKIESVLMLSMAVLLIAGAIVLGKNIYRVVY